MCDRRTPFNFWRSDLRRRSIITAQEHCYWVVGLDGLLGAGKRDIFEARLIRLLGKDTLVLPEDYIGRQPSYTVGSVAGKVFDWRNLIAHGNEILEDYRKPLRLEFEPTDFSSLSDVEWTHEILYCEGALFLLMASLRKVIADGLMPLLGNRRTWTKWLSS